MQASKQKTYRTLLLNPPRMASELVKPSASTVVCPPLPKFTWFTWSTSAVPFPSRSTPIFSHSLLHGKAASECCTVLVMAMACRLM